MTPSSGAGSPNEFLSSSIGNSIRVRLSSGVDYVGTLVSVDGYMNLVMANAQEQVDGKATNKYNDIFLRGNNVLYFSNQP
ncbi:putative U6 snRNA-associated Sm-like protein LSm6 [Ramicandelaber brevisporus]|nr:putative U6 snRNA-associated Sm-like protein LSm6 [Ramicandelaber brevisporus]